MCFHLTFAVLVFFQYEMCARWMHHFSYESKRPRQPLSFLHLQEEQNSHIHGRFRLEVGISIDLLVVVTKQRLRLFKKIFFFGFGYTVILTSVFQACVLASQVAGLRSNCSGTKCTRPWKSRRCAYSSFFFVPPFLFLLFIDLVSGYPIRCSTRDHARISFQRRQWGKSSWELRSRPFRRARSNGIRDGSVPKRKQIFSSLRAWHSVLVFPLRF